MIDHSVQIDEYGTPGAFRKNVDLEYARNRERYLFLRWGQQALANMKVVPPGTGICHQVNLEYLAKVVFTEQVNGVTLAYPDSLVGTDSHTTMINGLGVFGWGVGGIEAEAVMLGQPMAMLIPEVVGFELTGQLPPGATATDLVLTVTQMLRKKGVVDKFVEFYGAGIGALSLPDRATIANMAPEYGATMGFFPVDDETLAYLRFTGRPNDHVAAGRALLQGEHAVARPERQAPLLRHAVARPLAPSSRRSPALPARRIASRSRPRAARGAAPSAASSARSADADAAAIESLGRMKAATPRRPACCRRRSPSRPTRARSTLGHGSVVIAAITSCTNTSNPSVLMAAGLLAQQGRRQGPDHASRGSRRRSRPARRSSPTT